MYVYLGHHVPKEKKQSPPTKPKISAPDGVQIVQEIIHVCIYTHTHAYSAITSKKKNNRAPPPSPK